MKFKPKIGFCVIYHPFEENADSAPEIFQESKKMLESLPELEIISAKKLIMNVDTGISVVNQFKEENVDIICVKLATWSSDEPVLKMESEYDVPFIFWTYPHIYAGSLCGGQQFNMVFKELGKESIFAYGDNHQTLQKIADYAKVVALKNILKRIRFGIIGNPTRGMTEVAYDKHAVKEIFGPTIFTLELDDFKESMLKINEKVANSIWEEIKSRAPKISVKDFEGIHAIKNYLALKKVIESEQLSGITIECYPNYMGEVCLGFSLLADEGIACACEADINSTMLMYIMMNLSQGPVHDIDPLYVYEENDSILGTHCGCGSFELADPTQKIELANVRLANRGLCVLFLSKPGNVTMANLVGKKGTYKLTIIEGEAIESSMEFPGNPIQIKLPVSINDYLDIVEEHGIGHHWIVAYGHFGNILSRLATLLQIDLIRI